MPDPQPPNSPRSKTDLFVSFTLLALQGFGGVLAVVQRELVEKKRWMTREQFVEEWAVAQIMPGPNVVNLAMMIGGRYFGLAGALAGLAGMLAAPLVVVLVLAVAFGAVSDSAWAQGALRGMGAVSAGLIAATALKLFPALHSNAMRGPVCLLFAGVSFAGVALLRLPLAAVLLGIGGLAWLWAWFVLGRQAGRPQDRA
jgi:chromate transporter